MLCLPSKKPWVLHNEDLLVSVPSDVVPACAEEVLCSSVWKERREADTRADTQRIVHAAPLPLAKLLKDC